MVDDGPAFSGAPDGPGSDRIPVRRGLSVAAGSFFFSVFVGLGSSVATSRLYGIDIIGEYALVCAPYLIVSQLSSVNEQVAFVREAASLPRRDIRLSALFRAMVGFSTLLTAGVSLLGMVIGALLLRGPIGRPDLVLPAGVVLGAYVLFDNMSWNIDSLLSAFRSAGTLFVARASQVLVFLGFAVTFAWWLDSVWGLVWATVLSFVVPLAVRLAVLSRYVDLRVSAAARRNARGELPAMLRFGLVLLPSHLANGITQQAGTWVVGAVGSVATTGAYSRALGLASKLSEAGYRICEILMPGIVEQRSRGDHTGAVDLLRRTVLMTLVGLTAVVAPAGGAAPGVLRVFGPGFDRGATVLALLLVAYALAVINSVQFQGYLADGLPGKVTRLTLLRALAVVALMWPLAVHFGAAGVAAAYVAGQVLGFLLIDRSMAIHEGTGRTFLGLRAVVGVTAAYAAGFISARAVVTASPGMPMTAVALVAGTAAALSVLVMARLVQLEELDRIRRRFHRR